MSEQKQAVEGDLQEFKRQVAAKKDELAKLDNRENAEQHKVQADN